MPPQQSSHISVLLDGVVAALRPALEVPGAHAVDATFGAGGYSRALLEQTHCRVTAIDRDPSVAAFADPLAEAFPGRLSLLHSPFGQLASLLTQHILPPVDGLAVDLGVSSMQLDQADRGFSFRFDGPLDMRMGDDGPTAADLVAQLPEAELADIIWRYGEERRSRAVARRIVETRKASPLTTTAQLAEVVRSVVRASKDGIDPATRTFQGLRIAVNDELGEVERLLDSLPEIMAEVGRVAIVTFHSLEDRIVKDRFRTLCGRQPQGSRHLPHLGPTTTPAFAAITTKPILPTAEEIAANPRARSAKLRVIERRR